MKLKRIDLLSSHASDSVSATFTSELAEALTRQGINCRLLVLKKESSKHFLEQIFSDPPDCTLSFNGLLPDAKGHFLSDLIHIPHLAYITESFHHFFDLAQSSMNSIACADAFFCKTFADFGFCRTLFLPQGIDKNLKPLNEPAVEYEAVMFSNFLDPLKIKERWKKKYPEAICKMLQEAAENTLSSTSLSYIEAFTHAFNILLEAYPLDPTCFSQENLLEDLELYIRAVDCVELLKAVKETPVHVFGSCRTSEEWQALLGKEHSPIISHPTVSYPKSIEILQKSKIVLVSTPTRSSNEMIFAGLASGAAVLTTEHEWLKKFFKDKESLLFYHRKRPHLIPETLSYYLENEPERRALASKGRAIVMTQHTWDQRAQTLVEKLPDLLNQAVSNV